MRLKVTVVAGLHADVAAEAVERMLGAAPGRAAVLEHDIAQLASGRVVRTIRDAAGSQHLVVDLAHGCVGCTLRESVLPALGECVRHGRYDHVILALPPAIEPHAVAGALADLVEVHAVVTAVAPGRLVADADTGDTLAERGLACAGTDDRFVAEVLLRQIEYADVLVGPPTPGTGLHLLGHLSPAVPLVDLRRAGFVVRGARRHDPRAAQARRAPGAYVASGVGVGPVGSLLWRSRRPIHPERLYAAFDRLVPAVVRTRGLIWLATRPDERQSLATSGPRVELSPAGSWDPTRGNWGSELVLTGLDLDRDALRTLLDNTTLTDAEAAVFSK